MSGRTPLADRVRSLGFGWSPKPQEGRLPEAERREERTGVPIAAILAEEERRARVVTAAAARAEQAHEIARTPRSSLDRMAVH
ncbi:MAG: hypothetical protein M1126_06950 [Candidatus Thermoplasmatota archaeon]|nr:hypothetical protein [Candidatus Thermoplasmatota archaeon]